MSSKYPGGIITTGADTGYSVAFDGTTDYLTIPNAAWMNLGTSDFTMECWVYFNVVSATQMFVTNSYNAGTGAGGWAFLYRQDNTTLKFSVNSNVAYEKTWSPVASKWYHVAVSRSGSSLRMFVDGTQVGTTSTSTDNISGASSTMWVGSNETTSYAMNGFISSMRITTTALYTTTFTPPTQLFSVPGTQFLSLQNPRFVDVSNNAAVITANGNIAVSNFTPFVGYKGFDPAMGAGAHGIWSIEEATNYQSNREWPIYDPYFNQTTLLLHGNGTNNANNNSFIDSSSNNFAITRNGNTTQGTFTPFSQTGWSNYFNGSTDYLSVPSSANLAIGTGDYTLEAWLYMSSTSFSSQCFYGGTSSGGPIFTIRSQTSLVINPYGSGDTCTFTGAYFPANQWYHIAITRQSSTARLFVNGVLASTTTDSGNYGQTVVGVGGIGLYYWTGYVSNLRFIKGSAIYTSSFTPSTAPLTAVTGTQLLTSQSQRFVDNSANNFAITVNGTPSVQAFSPFVPAYITPTTYSNRFDGTGDYLTVPSSSAFQFDSGNFTVEMWIYFNSVGNAQLLSIPVVGALYFQYYAGGLDFGNNSTNLNGSWSPVAGTWYHLAAVRNGSNLTTYVNGAVLATTNSAFNVTATGTLQIGYGGAGTFNGLMSNIRIVKGTAVYTSAFTPPSAPLTNITGTSLLTCQSSTIIDNSSNAFTITAYGDTKPVSSPTPFPPKVDTTTLNSAYSTSLVGGSGYFDGSGDYLSVPSAAALQLTTSAPFTIEAWVYPTALGGDCGIIGKRPGASGAGVEWQFFFKSDKTLHLYNGTNDYSSGTTIGGINQWVHAAVSWDLTTLRFFLNGDLCSSTYTGIALGTAGSSVVTIGGDYPNGELWTGYLNGVRLVKGTALYTRSFSPPTTPFTLVSNTSLLCNFTDAGIIDSTSKNVFETVGDAKISTTVSKFGGSSMYFDGTTDWLIARNTPNLQFGSGDFTIELWVYFSESGRQQSILNKNDYGQWGQWFLYLSSGNAISFGASSANASADVVNASFGTPIFNAWNHIAVCRSGASFKGYINGTGYTFGTSSTALYTDPYSLRIGANGNSSGAESGTQLNGYIQDIRLTKGVARYTSNFIPQTSVWQNQ